MKNIAVKGIYSVYIALKGSVLFDEDKTNQRNAKLYKYAHKQRSKK